MGAVALATLRTFSAASAAISRSCLKIRALEHYHAQLLVMRPIHRILATLPSTSHFEQVGESWTLRIKQRWRRQRGCLHDRRLLLLRSHDHWRRRRSRLRQVLVFVLGVVERKVWIECGQLRLRRLLRCPQALARLFQERIGWHIVILRLYLLVA